MNQISDPANVYEFGRDFNYALWTENTRVTLCNVRWDNTYRDIVEFTDRNALNTYIDDLETVSITIEDLSYVKPNIPIRIPTPLNAAQKFNYLRASNPAMPFGGDTPRDFYYFILDVRYVAAGTTEVVIQLDVWQTFGFDVSFGNCYLERGHIAIANENNFDNFGRDWLTVPEGIDLGGEYRNIERKYETVMGIKNDIQTVDGHANTKVMVQDFDVLVVSTVSLTDDPGTVSAPILISGNGSSFDGLASGSEIYVFRTVSAFKLFMSNMSDKPWVTQGIISITLIPSLTRYQEDFVYDPTNGPSDVTEFTFGGHTLVHNMFVGWRDAILEHIPLRYRHLKKFLTYPYMAIQMTTWTGKPIIVKPESWADPDATIVERVTLTPPNQRIEFYPRRYNTSVDSTIDNVGHVDDETKWVWDGYEDLPDRFKNGDDGGDYIDLVTMITNFPTMAIVNNGALSYLSANTNGIAFQHSSADWSQTRALGSNQTSYDQATAGIETSKNLNRIDRMMMGASTMNDQTALLESTAANGLANILGAGIGIATGGGGKGAAGMAGNAVLSQIMGGVSADIQIKNSTNQLNARQGASATSNTLQNNQAGLLRDTNKSLADWAARGDYANTINGINAKVRDANLIQPSTSGQIGGEAMNIVNGAMEVNLRWKLIDNASIRTVGEIWLRYGYAIRKFATIENLSVMTKFTYWKFSESYLNSAPMPESFKAAIRGIFEKGVTVWKNPNDIGNIDIADNVPLPGVAL